VTQRRLDRYRQTPHATAESQGVTAGKEREMAPEHTPLSSGKEDAPTNEQQPPPGFVPVGTWTVLENGKQGFALQPKLTQVGWKQVFRGTNHRTLMCKHGETSRAIFHRLNKPACVTSDELASGAACTCKNTLLLRSSKGARSQPEDWSPPKSLYALLGGLGVEEIDFGHDRIGRRMKCNRVPTKLFCLPNGMMRCEHGNSEATLRAARRGVRKPRTPCDCLLTLSGTMMRSYFAPTGTARGGGWPTVDD
jgi:hypothetical protein